MSRRAKPKTEPKEPRTPVASFGLHRQDDLVFLMEERKGRCITPGLAELPCPFQVELPYSVRCPHQLPDPVPGIVPDDRLFEAFTIAPQERPGFYWISPAMLSMATDASLHMVQRVAEQSVFAGREIRSVQRRLTLTNCLPLLLINYSAAQWHMVSDLGRMLRTRPLIVSGYPQIPEAIDITPEVMTKRSPEEWRGIAAAQLYNWLEEVTRHETV